jgi:uncharacterized lipoprotein YmbA
MNTIARRSGLVCLLAALLSLAACTTYAPQRTNFYRLDTADEVPKRSDESPARASVQPLLGVGPVRLASYLDRPQLIQRVSPYRLELQDFHHWAGKLQDNINLVLVDSLQARLGTHAVIGYPWHRAVKPRYELSVDISRLDAERERVLLHARWALVDEGTGRLRDLQQVRIAEALQGTGPEAQVAAASRALQQLGTRLASHLQVMLTAP